MTEADPVGEAAERGRALLRLARAELERSVAGRAVAGRPDPPWLREPGAVFVTLRLDGALRGCIGSIHARRPLGDDVRSNARAAALEDPRFPPLQAGEVARVRLEVSLLGPLEPIEAADRDELLRSLRPALDGLYLEAGPHRATFLPQVWDSLPRTADFVAKLMQKAGLSEREWPPGIRWWRFGVSHWTEEEPTSVT